MPRFHRYDELAGRTPIPVKDVQWLAAQIAALPPFRAGVAVLCGSLAWGTPSWRSDIDVVMFRTEEHNEPDTEPILRNYERSAQGRYLLPKVDVIVTGVESERLVTRENLVSGSVPITSMQTVRELFAATSLRFYDHIGALATVQGDPWRTFHETYLADGQRTQKTRRTMIQDYVTSFTRTWLGQPLWQVASDLERPLEADELEAMGFAENFPYHLMRQILAERGEYPVPDRAEDVAAAFGRISKRWAVKLRAALAPFLRIGPTYDALVRDCHRIMPREYHERLVTLFDALPFTEVREITWNYLSGNPLRRRRW